MNAGWRGGRGGGVVAGHYVVGLNVLLSPERIGECGYIRVQSHVYQHIGLTVCEGRI